jgi:hypothetical protein
MPRFAVVRAFAILTSVYRKPYWRVTGTGEARNLDKLKTARRGYGPDITAIT